MASLAFLIGVGSASGCHSAVSSTAARPAHLPTNLREIIFDAIVIVWFFGAVALTSGKCIGRIPSLLGCGSAACGFAAAVVIAIGLCFSSDIRDVSVGIFVAVLFAVLCAICVALFVGILKMRSEKVQSS